MKERAICFTLRLIFTGSVNSAAEIILPTSFSLSLILDRANSQRSVPGWRGSFRGHRARDRLPKVFVLLQMPDVPRPARTSWGRRRIHGRSSLLVRMYRKGCAPLQDDFSTPRP